MSQGEETRCEEDTVKPNKADAPNAAMTLRFQFEDHWRGVGDLPRSAT